MNMVKEKTNSGDKPVSGLSGLSRRNFLGAAASGLTLFSSLSPLHSVGSVNALTSNQKENEQSNILRGTQFDLSIGYKKINITGKERLATVVNDSLPAPTLYWKEGQRVTIRVTNNLAVDTSIHWHGIILPTSMDGVPGLSFMGIKPGETFEYSFDVNQSGTYWYHSHSGFQEQTGLYGAIVVEPKEKDSVVSDRDHVVILSDWSDEQPEKVYRNLKKLPHYYNTNERTLNDLYRDIKNKGIEQTWQERAMWNEMRMSDRDISDVTGAAYTFLVNGRTSDQNWLGLFNKGEKVRLRFINAAAMTLFDVRIPGLKMTVVASDGQDIEPISVDEFRIGVAETYDVIVEPDSDSAYTLFAQAIDRSGFTRATLAADPSLKALIPDMDPSPILSHGDMGMDHSSMNHAGMNHAGMNHAGMDHSMHHGMGDAMSSMANKPAMGSGLAGFGSNQTIQHAESEYGPHIDMRAEMPQYRLDDPGIGLRDHQKLYGRKVLTYADIKNRYRTLDARQPGREIELHLTGNMSRYMWSINGIKFADAEPLHLKYGERVRITLVNDTMMNHPIHLHGMWSELETGDADYIPRKHTVIVQPGSKLSYLVTADAKGRWAYHCHLLYHMLGMFREVRVA